MKKLYLLLLLFAFAGCKKQSTTDNSIYNIEYRINVTGGNYNVSYNDETGDIKTDTFSGASYSKTIKLPVNSTVKEVYFTVYCTEPQPNFTGNMYITVNGQNKNQASCLFNKTSGNVSYNLRYVPGY